MIEGNLKHLNFNHLSLLDLHPYTFQSLLPFITKLIQEKRIERGLALTLFSITKENLGNSLDSLEEFFHTISASHLQSFAFDISVHVPLNAIPQFSRSPTRWDYLCINGNFREEAAAKIHPFPVLEFDCLGRYRTHEYVESKSKLLSVGREVTRLICSDGFIEHISKEFSPTWEGFGNTERIDLFIVENLDALWFARFENLRHVCLSFYAFFLVDHDDDVLFDLISSLPSLETITVDNDCVDDVVIFIQFLEKLSQVEAKPDRDVYLGNMEVSLPLDVEPLTSFCECLETCLRRKILGSFTFHIITDPKLITHHPITDHFLNQTDFIIESEPYERKGLNSISIVDEDDKIYEKVRVSRVLT